MLFSSCCNLNVWMGHNRMAFSATLKLIKRKQDYMTLLGKKILRVDSTVETLQRKRQWKWGGGYILAVFGARMTHFLCTQEATHLLPILPPTINHLSPTFPVMEISEPLSILTASGRWFVIQKILKSKLEFFSLGKLKDREMYCNVAISLSEQYQGTEGSGGDERGDERGEQLPSVHLGPSFSSLSKWLIIPCRRQPHKPLWISLSILTKGGGDTRD